MDKAATKPDEHRPLANIVFNIVIPVILLHRLSHYFGDRGPLIAVIVALLFPLGYGLHDFIRQKRLNFFSLIGLINVVVTGSLALASLHGKWFVAKDAAFPALLGIAVLI